MGLVSKQLVDFVKKFEGFSATPYLDPVGVKTLEYGMTGAEIKGLDSITEEQASSMLEDLLNNKYAAPLKADLDSKGVQLNQSQFAALVSMAYNVGVNGILGNNTRAAVVEFQSNNGLSADGIVGNNTWLRLIG